MKPNRTKSAALAAAAALLLVPASASAAALNGGTSQKGKTIKLRTEGDGSVNFAKITWLTSCRYGGKLSGKSSFPAKSFDRSTPAGFRSADDDVDKQGKYKLTFRSTIEGSAKGAGYAGTFKSTVRVEKKGKYWTTCKTGKIRWVAGP